MKIGIIGAGSIGLLFASYLSKEHQVTLYCRTEIQAKTINEKGVVLKQKDSEKHISLKAKGSAFPEEEDLYIIAVKQYHLQNMEQIFCRISPDIPLIFVQNGLGHLSIIDSLNHKTVYLGITEHGALKDDCRTVNHTGKGTTKIAVYRGNEDSLQKLAQELTGDQFPFLAEDSWKDMLYGKLIVNAVINPLTAILKVKNGELIQNDHYYQLLKLIFDETADVLKISGRDEMLARVVRVCRQTGENESSMLRDVLSGRQTEIDGIVGFLLKKAQEEMIPVPHLQFVYHCIKGMEQ